MRFSYNKKKLDCSHSSLLFFCLPWAGCHFVALQCLMILDCHLASSCCQGYHHLHPVDFLFEISVVYKDTARVL